MELGVAVRVTVGGGVVTVTVVERFVVPPDPVQERVYDVVLVGVTVSVSAVALAPLQPPEAVQLVALLVVHPSTLDCPAVMPAGVALSVTVGGPPSFEVGLEQARLVPANRARRSGRDIDSLLVRTNARRAVAGRKGDAKYVGLPLSCNANLSLVGGRGVDLGWSRQTACPLPFSGPGSMDNSWPDPGDSPRSSRPHARPICTFKGRTLGRLLYL
jgi:hypothetical protein